MRTNRLRQLLSNGRLNRLRRLEETKPIDKCTAPANQWWTGRALDWSCLYCVLDRATPQTTLPTTYPTLSHTYHRYVRMYTRYKRQNNSVCFIDKVSNCFLLLLRDGDSWFYPICDNICGNVFCNIA